MRKKCNRKVWLSHLTPLEHAKLKAGKLSDKEWNVQMKPVLSAIERISRGDWDKEECWSPIFQCLNRIESAVKLHRIDGKQFINNAVLALQEIMRRWENKGVQALKADELLTLREVVAAYGDLLKEMSRGQFESVCNHATSNLTRILTQKKFTKINGAAFG